jgi:REP element-mobilizing transposase RayT
MGPSKYDPQYHHRKSIRLQGYDYSQAGMYFITICAHKHKHHFGRIVVGAGLAPAHLAPDHAQQDNGQEEAQMILNDFGQIAHNEWEDLPNRFKNTFLREFQVMPNHMHGIIGIDHNYKPAEDEPVYAISDIVGAYKSLVAKGCLNVHTNNLNNNSASTREGARLGKIWQRNYFEHIIRDEESYNKIANYIINNPANWKNDQFYTDGQETV